MNNDQQLREHVLYLLRGGGAHLGFEDAVADLPVDLRGARPRGIPHTPWRLLEHMRICQWDILEYCRNPEHRSPDFPEGYWPTGDAPPSDDEWEKSLSAFRRDLNAVIDMASDPSQDLLRPLPHGKSGHTLLREALLIADHQAYHLGQLVVVRRALGAWPEDGQQQDSSGRFPT